MDDVLCTHLQEENGVLTGNAEGEFCYGPEKGRRLTEFCMLSGSDPLTAWHYGDSVSDLSAFEASGNRVCVNPDKKLRKIAIKRGWRIEDW
jgi:phosphoserine phosphatase